VGLISVWGRSGWLSRLSETAFGVPLDVPLFGLGSVVGAHLILDGAFAARILLVRLDAIPESRLKTGQSLGLTARQRFAIIDWPAIRSTLPGLGAVIFLLAFTSFPIVLLLGGGPSVQTLEVAIYSAVRLDFDLDTAVTLALLQIGICAIIILLAAAAPPISVGLAQPAVMRWRDGFGARLLQIFVLLIGTLGCGLPLLAVLADGFSGAAQLVSQPQFGRALATSLGIAVTSAFLTLVLGAVLAASRAASNNGLLRVGIGTPAYAYLAVPAVALSLGAFLLIRNLGVAPQAAAPLVVIVANALLALPFAMATLAPSFDSIVRSRGRLMRSLGLSSRQQWRLVEWPLLGRDIGVVFALAFCFSLGDLGVIVLFGTEDFATLPLLMLRALGAYRGNDAAAIAALMLVLTVAAFTLLPPLFERLSRARS
jgi:thiamine transport system permease protein